MNVISIGIFAIIFLILIGILSNVSDAGQKNIQDQMFLMNCPKPIYSGVIGNVTFTSYFSFNYTTSQTAGNATGTFFECRLDFLSVNHPALSIIEKEYGHTVFSAIPDGALLWIGDTLYIVGQNVTAFLTLITYFVTPVNFNILGITVSDLGGIALTVVIATYALCYIFIGIFLYKTVSPFGGGG